nr:HAD hydrolase-like protein [uncultured Limnohabitans sp.]
MNIAFDLDGTLITAKERQSSLLLATAKAHGITFDVNLAWEMKRAGANNLVVLNKFGVDEFIAAKIDTAWRCQIESAYWLSIDRVYSDVVDFLQDLKACGAVLHLITARKNKYLLHQQLCRLGLFGVFSSITCVAPFGAVAEKARVLSEINPVCFIGDSETDFNSAVLAEVSFHGVSTGQRSKEYLKSLGVVDVVESLNSLFPVLTKILKH